MCNAKLFCSTALSTGFSSRQASRYKSSNKLFRVHFGVLLYSAVSTCYIIVKLFGSLLCGAVKVTVNKIGYLPGKSSCARYFKRNPENLYITEKLIKCRF